MSTEETALPPAAPVTSAAEPAPVVAATPPAPAAPPVKESLRDTITRAVQNPQARPGTNHTRARDESGKFVQTAPIPPAFPTPETAKRPAMPKWIPIDRASHWENTPVELAEIVARREADHEQGVKPLIEKSRFADEINRVMTPYAEILRNEGATPSKAIQNLMESAALLRNGTPSQKARFTAQMIRQFNVPTEELQQFLSAPLPQQPAVDPQVSQLTQQVEQLTAYQQQQEDARVQGLLAEFSSDPAHKHWEVVRSQMAAIIQNPSAFRVEAASDRELMDKAYKLAVKMDEGIQAADVAEQQAKEKAALQVQNAKNAALSVKGAPAALPIPKANPNDRRETLRQAFQATR